MKVFLDTNVLASALISRGLCSELFEVVLQSHTLILSKPLTDELRRVLPEKLGISEKITLDFLELLESHAIFSKGKPIPVELPDADDIPVVGSAITADADVFVTGDKALLEVAEAGGLRLLSPRDFWEILSKT